MKDINNINVLKVADFDFSLPEELIALTPSEKRDEARLMVLHKDGGIEERQFHDIHEYLNEGDMLLLNNTKVFPAKLTGTKPTGGKIGFLLVNEIAKDEWSVLSRKKYTGELAIADGFSAEITDGEKVRFKYNGAFIENLSKYGEMPLPPYIKRKPEARDREWYQTVYAKELGSIAAPTAGMHFTQELIKKIEGKGVKIKYLTLHIGIGTFKPIKTEKVYEHKMDQEYFEIETELLNEINNTKGSGKKIISSGTTTTRAIEGCLSGYCRSGENKEGSRIKNKNSKTVKGYTDIFIYPGYKFRAVDSLITNFHLPRSTPLMLTSALCGFSRLKEAYERAVKSRYRFFSYGDAMLIL
ncbi:MAG: tRNA preQ1(34) S-adenosylmethionine ribosyltransferase-isomerase QueA [Nitrospiraceae bacterium]|nr:tRNA preQ1(34) S-adenosylmethionine ribosyltransferase-isomerase QueA [Nitrospiraceae bacterium]